MWTNNICMERRTSHHICCGYIEWSVVLWTGGLPNIWLPSGSLTRRAQHASAQQPGKTPSAAGSPGQHSLGIPWKTFLMAGFLILKRTNKTYHRKYWKTPNQTQSSLEAGRREKSGTGMSSRTAGTWPWNSAQFCLSRMPAWMPWFEHHCVHHGNSDCVCRRPPRLSTIIILLQSFPLPRQILSQPHAEPKINNMVVFSISTLRPWTVLIEVKPWAWQTPAWKGTPVKESGLWPGVVVSGSNLTWVRT